jgi:uncharacterized protein (TIGR02147 family)
VESISPIFKYESARRYLVDYVSHKQAVDPTFSLRKWSKAMGMTSHAHLVMILQGKRTLTLKQVPFLAKGMSLSSPERLYLQALIQFENATTEEEKELCRLWLSEANPGSAFHVREVDEYIVISHWIHMAILALTDNKSFRGSAEEIYKRLRGKTSIAEIRSALERLKALNLICEQNGKLVCTYQRVTTKDDVANRGAREYHKQVARLAIDAIEQQSIDEREFQSFAVSLPHSKLKLAKEMIRKFRTQLYEAMTSEPGDEVYQTQIQFFRLTECPSEMVPKEDEGAGSKSPNLTH